MSSIGGRLSCSLWCLQYLRGQNPPCTLCDRGQEGVKLWLGHHGAPCAQRPSSPAPLDASPPGTRSGPQGPVAGILNPGHSPDMGFSILSCGMRARILLVPPGAPVDAFALCELAERRSEGGSKSVGHGNSAEGTSVGGFPEAHVLP